MSKRITTEEQFERLLETATVEQLERFAGQISLTKRLRFGIVPAAKAKRTKQIPLELNK